MLYEDIAVLSRVSYICLDASPRNYFFRVAVCFFQKHVRASDDHETSS